MISIILNNAQNQEKRENMKLREDLPNFLAGENKKTWKDIGFEEKMAVDFPKLMKVLNPQTLGTQWIPNRVKKHNPHLAV